MLQVRGKPAIDKKELMDTLNSLHTREKATCLVNLITTNRPSEMVRLKISDFDLKNKSVYVYLKKQKNGILNGSRQKLSMQLTFIYANTALNKTITF